MSQITRIEVSFAVPVELNDAERHKLHDLVSLIALRTQPKGHVYYSREFTLNRTFIASNSVL